jgi:hypothetical protein
MTYTDEQTGEPLRTRNGRLVLHVLPAQVDKKLANAETYALAKAIYLDRKFGRDSNDLATILIDVRPGQGWSNPKAFTMVPYIRSVSRILHQYFPQRMDKCLVYPLPTAALVIWDMARPVLDRSIVDAITLVQGSDALAAPPPNAELGKYLEEDMLEKMEAKRRSLFVSSL